LAFDGRQLKIRDNRELHSDSVRAPAFRIALKFREAPWSIEIVSSDDKDKVSVKKRRGTEPNS
jgi:hypothetical protein